MLLTSVSHQEGNTFAQCTRQLILTMSSALGRRMKQRFDLIGCEKVSRSGPAGEMGGLRRAGGWKEGRSGGQEASCTGQGQMQRAFDLSV